ncbi:MAG: arylsulfatase, partial [Bacteroidales bacterium]|nr:arylsulfatase [Bacteroidales bacterium]
AVINRTDWKIVSKKGQSWELYNMNTDRTELSNLANDSTELLNLLVEKYREWAAEINVKQL